MSTSRASVANALAAALLDGEWKSVTTLAGRGARALGVSQRRLGAVAGDVLAAYREPPLDRRRELSSYLLELPSFHVLWEGPGRPPIVQRHRLPLADMGRARWPVPTIATSLELASWAEEDLSVLDWYADVRSLERSAAPKLRHYDREWRYNRRGGVRLLERPRSRIKGLQRRVLREMLDVVPAHGAAHGFVAGRSVVSFVTPHVGRDVVVRLDLTACFASITAPRVFGVFRMLGYPEAVAHTLTGLSTTVVPRDVLRSAPQALRNEDLDARRWLLTRLAEPHLPQGSPTSPALANLVLFHLDARLSGLAAAAGASYSRYADDLAFSLDGTDAVRRAKRLVASARSVVADERLRLNDAKTSITRRSQRQVLCGVVVNDKPAVERRRRESLRAALHNIRQHGPESQNRAGHEDFRAHLLGEIAWVSAVNPDHGERLRSEFAQITWSELGPGASQP
ncbi:MAG: RNA-directed DNA polymerase [Frankiaceae bacterium]|nr:RNA-directed DNA polymerase [Frankiaceae bacterium]MBV9871975.1 RNA-directed DNA polymerase [Frankiaceae bacterium]